jgi:hypothetical protein
MRSPNQYASSKLASHTEVDLSTPLTHSERHDPDKLAAAIGRVYFMEYLDSDVYLFDYDDTLVGRRNRHPRSSSFNRQAISRLNRTTEVRICAGNAIAAINLVEEQAASAEGAQPTRKPLIVFAHGGVNEYLYDVTPAVCDDGLDPPIAMCISPDALLPTVGPKCAEDPGGFATGGCSSI